MKYMFSYKKGKVISEQIKSDELSEEDYKASPYVLSATSDGDIKVTNNTTKQTYVYSISAYGVAVDVKDFPGGDSIKVSIPLKGIETFDLPSGGEASNVIKNNVGKEKISVTMNGIIITLKCQSGCVKSSTSTNKSIFDAVSDATKSTFNTVSDVTKSTFNTVSDEAKSIANSTKSFLGF